MFSSGKLAFFVIVVFSVSIADGIWFGKSGLADHIQSKRTELIDDTAIETGAGDGKNKEARSNCM